MSLTLLQRFYEIAKQEAEAPALGVHGHEGFQSLPWWYVKSRIKHFGLGLLEMGAKPGDYFYLLPSRHHTWIYSELGALSMGLQTLPLPPGLTAIQIDSLFAKYPPAFIYWGDGSPESVAWPSYKSLKALVTKSEDPLNIEIPPADFLTFRQVFNTGIQFESKHHAAYRRIRDALSPEQTMSPINVEASGQVVERPLKYQHVNAAMTHLLQTFQLPKMRKLFSDVDFWWTQGRVVALYCPFFLALEAVLGTNTQALFAQLQSTAPDLIFLGDSRLAQLEQELSSCLTDQPPPVFNGVQLQGRWRAFLQKRWIRRQLGGRARCLLGSRSLSEAAKKWLDAAKIRSLTLEASQP